MLFGSLDTELPDLRAPDEVSRFELGRVAGLAAGDLEGSEALLLADEGANWAG